MTWKKDLIDALSSGTPCGYSVEGPRASEPTALAGLAMLAHGHSHGAGLAAEWLSDLQAADGSVGVTESDVQPKWPTSLSILLWRQLDRATGQTRFKDDIGRAIAWALTNRGRPLPRDPSIGHDTTLIGWSWAAETHSWLEPSALFVLALKSVGLSDHVRTREAVQLLRDRLLADGGCNYGNTVVLGQQLLPHLQPTGLVLLALSGETTTDVRIKKSLEYLRSELTAETPTVSLCYGLLALAAYGQALPAAEQWLEQRYSEASDRPVGPLNLSMLALASADTNPLLIS